jgi:hypothetical protein
MPMSVFDKLRAWWGRDAGETTEEETHMTPEERAEAERDYQAIRDDTYVENSRLGLGAADYERDSEPPR